MNLRIQHISIEQNTPLHDRVPTHDRNGELLSDFMVLVSGFRNWSSTRQQDTVRRIHEVLSSFQEVVFADLNTRLNLLWVSVNAKPGIVSEIYCALKQYIPELTLVGPYAPSG